MQIITFFGFTIIVAVISYIKKTKNVKEDSSDGYFLSSRSPDTVLYVRSLFSLNLQKRNSYIK